MTPYTTMSTRLKMHCSALLLGGLLLGCGAPSSGPDMTPAPRTIGQQCRSIADAYCTRVVQECNAGGTVAACVEPFVDDCCTFQCALPAKSPETAITQCTLDIRRAACSFLIKPDVPASCVGAVRW